MSIRIKERRRLTPESTLKAAVKEYLNITGWFCFPILQGLGAYKGISDLIALKEGKVLFIELKSPKGKLSPYQEAFKQAVESYGGAYIVVRSVDDLMELSQERSI